jgi:hypothetical protein
MSSDEIRAYGSTLLGDPYACAFVLWRYFDTSVFDYYERPDISDAVADLAVLAARRPAPICEFH